MHEAAFSFVVSTCAPPPYESCYRKCKGSPSPKSCSSGCCFQARDSNLRKLAYAGSLGRLNHHGRTSLSRHANSHHGSNGGSGAHHHHHPNAATTNSNLALRTAV